MANISDKIIPFTHLLKHQWTGSISKNAVLIKQKDTAAFYVNVLFLQLSY